MISHMSELGRLNTVFVPFLTDICNVALPVEIVTRGVAEIVAVKPVVPLLKVIADTDANGFNLLGVVHENDYGSLLLSKLTCENS